MTRQYYEKVNGTTVRVWTLEKTLTKADLEAKVVDIQNILDLGDEEKQILLSHSSAQNIEQFDLYLGLLQGEQKDLIDYWDYETQDHTLSNMEGMWMSPATVHSFCGEETGYEAVNAVDGGLASQWRHNADERHWIILDLGYNKKISKIRIPVGAADPEASQLEEVDVWIGRDVTSGSKVGSSLDFQTLDDYNENNLSISVGRYIKLDRIHSLHASNIIRIREIEVYVKTMGHEV